MLKVVELPHPNDLAFHALAGIDSPLIHWAILTFLVQLWQKGDLVCMVAGELPDTTGKILSIDMQNQSTVINIHHDKGPVECSCPLSHLQHMHKCGDWVKVFAGLDKEIEGCVMNHVGENLVLAVHRVGETVKVHA